MDSNSINKNVAYTSIARFFALAFTLVYSVLLVRLLGAEGNGVFSFLVVNAQLGLLFLGLNINGGLSYYIAKGNFPREKVIGFAFLILVIAGIIVLLVSSSLYYFQPPTLELILPIGYQELFFLLFFLFSFIAQVIIGFCVSFSLGSFSYRIYNQYIFISSFTKVFCITIYYACVQTGYISNDLKEIFTLFLGIELLFSVIFLGYLNTRLSIKISFHFPIQSFVKPFLIYSAKGWLIGLLRFFNNRFFNWVISFYQGLTSLGYISLAVGLYSNAEQVLTPINQALRPYLVKMPVEEGKSHFLFYLRLSNTIAIFMAIMTFLLSPFFIPFIFGKEFEASVTVTQIIFFSMPFLSLRGMGAAYTASHNKHQFIVIAEAFAFAFTVVFDLIIIPQYGILGASWVMFFASGISAAVISYFVVTRMQVPIFKNLLITRNDLIKIRSLIRDRLKSFSKSNN